MVLVAALGVLAAAPAAAWADPKGGGKAAVYKTPQEAFKALTGALDKGDYKKFVKCLTPESRDLLAGELAMFGGMMIGLADKFSGGKGTDAKGMEEVQALKKVFDKHGLGEGARKGLKVHPPKDQKKTKPKSPEDIKKELKLFARLVIKDRDGFTVDMLSIGPSKKPVEGKPKLEDLKTEGKSAKGVVVYQDKGKEKRDPIGFKKLGQGWKVEWSLPLAQPAGPPVKPPKK
jgi:hypothetical protein